MRWFVPALLIVLSAGASLAQQVPPPPEGVPPLQTDAPTISLGDGTMSGSRLAPYDNAFALTLHFKDGHAADGGIWSDQLRLRDVDGKKAFVRTQGFVYPDGKSMWSVNRFDPLTLAPISSESHAHDGSFEIRTFKGAHVEVRKTAAGPDAKEEVQEVDLPKPAYDFFNCCMASLFSATLPLKSGYKAVAPAAMVTKADDPIVVYRVVGREKVKAGYLGEVEAYVVEFPNSGCCYIRFWIIDRAPFMVRMTLTEVAGKGYAQSFDMIGARQ
jgi:hypothetical protein